jgi:hypothetical protein
LKRFNSAISLCLAIAVLSPATRALRTPLLLQDVPWIKVDEYSHISFKEENARLNQFIIQLRAQKDVTAYVVTYAGRVSCAGEAQTRAQRIKNYLTRSGGIKAKRIRIIDVGYRQQWWTALYIAEPNMPPLTRTFLRSYQELLPLNQVQILKDCRGRLYR